MGHGKTLESLGKAAREISNPCLLEVEHIKRPIPIERLVRDQVSSFYVDMMGSYAIEFDGGHDLDVAVGILIKGHAISFTSVKRGITWKIHPDSVKKIQRAHDEERGFNRDQAAEDA